MVMSTIESIKRASSDGEALSVLSLIRLIEKAAILRNINRLTINRDKPAMLLNCSGVIRKFKGSKCVSTSIGCPEV